jgi:protocatechuate 3,4-dioxygenase beta subunit
LNVRSASLALLVLALIGFSVWALSDLGPTIAGGSGGADNRTNTPSTMGGDAKPTGDGAVRKSVPDRTPPAAPATEPDGLITGRVLDAFSARPIEGARVVVQSEWDGVLRATAGEIEPAVGTTSAGDGTYRLPVVTPKSSFEVYAVATCSDYLPTIRSLSPAHVRVGVPGEPTANAAGDPDGAAASFDFALVARRDAARVVGRVALPSGRAVTEVRIRLAATRSLALERGFTPFKDTKPNDAGRFELADLPPGRMRLLASCAGCATLERAVDLRRGGLIDIGTLVLKLETAGPDAATLHGEILTAAGAPSRNVTVRVDYGSPSGETGEDGSYRVTGIPLGAVRISIEAKDGARFTFEREFAAGEDVKYDHRWAKAEHFLGGIVLDDGEPVAGLEVETITRVGGGPSGATRGATRRTTTTDGEGKFRLDGLTSKNVDVLLRWNHDAYRDLLLKKVRADRDDLRLRFPVPRRMTVHGRVRSRGGSALGGVLVRWDSVNDQTDRAARAVTGAEGRFTIRVPATNQTSARLLAEKTGYRTERRIVHLAQVDRDYRLSWDVELLRMDELAVLHGVVRDAEGRPLAGARCRVRRVGAKWGLTTSWRDAETDDRGQYRIVGLEPGAHRLTVVHSAHLEYAREADVAAGGEPVDVQLARIEFGEVRFVFRAGKQPLAGLPVSLMCRHPFRLVNRESDAAGQVSVKDWPFGQTRVAINAEGRPAQATDIGTAALRRGSVPIEVRGGTGVIRGVLVSPRGASRVSELVAVEDKDPPKGGVRIYEEVWTDQEGRFRFAGLPAGEYFVSVAGEASTRVLVRPRDEELRIVFPR